MTFYDIDFRFDFAGIESKGVEELRFSAFRTFADSLDRSDLRDFGMWCDYIFSKKRKVPKTSSFGILGRINPLIESSFLVDKAWTPIDERFVRCILEAGEMVYEDAVPVLLRRAKDTTPKNEARVSKLLDQAGIDANKREELVFVESELMTREGALAPYGKEVLEMDLERATDLARRTDSSAKLASLYLQHAPALFEEAKEKFFAMEKDNPMGRAVLLNWMATHAPGEHRAYCMRLAEDLGTVAENARAHFLASFNLHRSFADFRGELLESFAPTAAAILKGDSDDWIHPAWDYAAGHSSLKARLVEWILENYGERTPELLAVYSEENYVLKLDRYYEPIATALGQAAVPLLVAGVMYEDLGPSVIGFMEHETFYQRILQLLAPLDISDYEEEIRQKLLNHENAGVRNVAKAVFETNTSEVRKVSVPESLALKDYADATAREVASAVRAASPRTPLEQINVAISFEEETKIPFFTLVYNGEHKDHFCSIDVGVFDDGDLQRFKVKHGLEESNQLETGDSMKLPLALLVYELSEALRFLPTLLRAQKVALSDEFTVRFDESDVEETSAARRASVARGMSYAFVDNYAATEFAHLIYEDSERREWLLGCASPLVHYSLDVLA